MCTFTYWLVGYGISFYSGNFFFGFNWWNSTNQTTTNPQWFYDNLVSATPVTIVSSSFLERCNPIAFLLNSVVISGKLFRKKRFQKLLSKICVRTFHELFKNVVFCGPAPLAASLIINLFAPKN